ncbi:MAG: hypothetical protein INR69_07170 [Mucilaginibacter polytrichastri]|nr:hypothetical protein [Mucilaginibacter polytrichastri]
MKRKLTHFLICGFACISAACAKQKTDSLSTQLISPDKTGAGIAVVHGPHLVIYDQAKVNEDKLFLMIVGTNADAAGGRELCTHFAQEGFRTISLDYKNTVITTTCTNSTDSTCFDRFREEIAFGTDVSADVDVDSTNSIVHRFEALLEYLVKNDPKGEWERFIQNGAIRWEKIAIGGHSQGAGHVGYLAEKFGVKRALIFSGPQDYLVNFKKPAGWLFRPGKTPVGNYYALLHTKDAFVFDRQLAACEALMHKKGDTVRVEPQKKISSAAHIFVTDVSTENAHMSTVEPQFTNVWDKMMGTD